MFLSVHMRSRLGATLAVLAAIALVRLVWVLFAVYVLVRLRRHHLESIWFLFIALCGLLILTRSAPLETGHPQATYGIPITRTIAFVAASFGLYWPALSVGFLSDDFVLRTTGAAATWDFYRPLPLLLWAPIGHLFGAVGLHALNISLHGLNGSLITALCARTLAVDKKVPAAMAAGLLFLSYPAAVEPVAWISGIFDVLLTTFALAFLLAASSRHPYRHLLCGLFLLGALLSKETAVVLPLIGIAITARRIEWGLLASLGSIVAAWACLHMVMVSTPLPLPRELSGYFFKELLGRPFASLTLPWTADEIGSHPILLGVLPQILVAALVLGHAIVTRDIAAVRLAVATFTACLPVFGVFFVSDALMGSRYLYLPLVGWSLLLIHVATRQPARVTQLVPGAIILLFITMWAFSVRGHLRSWELAGALRDRVLVEASDAHRRESCNEAEFLEVPDAIEGAYVFRNGFRQALDGRLNPAGSAVCRFIWTDDGFLRIR